MSARPHFLAFTPKRGEKAPPKSKPGAWDKPPREASHTKRGPGRKPIDSANAEAPRTAPMPPPEKKLRANVGGYVGSQYRRVWREGEPLHIVKPVRAARLKGAFNAYAVADAMLKARRT